MNDTKNYCDEHGIQCAKTEEIPEMKKCLSKKIDKTMFRWVIGILVLIMLSSFTFTFDRYSSNAEELKDHKDKALSMCDDVRRGIRDNQSNARLINADFTHIKEQLETVIDLQKETLEKVNDNTLEIDRLKRRPQ